MLDMKALVPVTINGEQLQMAIDSGAFYSTLTPAVAKHLNLRFEPLPDNFRMYGFNGAVNASVTTVNEFRLASLVIPHTQFIVGGTEMGGGAAGLLGQNLLGFADTEYDLANGIVRIMRPKDCSKQTLAYWTKTDPVSEIEIEPIQQARYHTIGSGYLNGKKIRVNFDTGTGLSMLSLKAAERAGIKPDSPGVVPAGSLTGLGRGWIRTWIATFESFKLGGEEIRNARLRFGDFNSEDGDLVIGADFFLSHHIYVSNAQSKLYFTYNGGPVFNLTAMKAPVAVDTAPASADSAPTATSESAPVLADAPDDAAGYSRRGMAFAARRDFERALADLDRACELAPQEASYFTERGQVRLQSGQADLALADFDQALLLRPDDIDARMTRALLRFRHDDSAGARNDLDAAALAATKEAEIRFALGVAYQQLGLLPEAIAQYDLWIAVHSEDSRLPTALNNRCWARALLDQDLDKALDDCNQAVRSVSKFARALDSRGLVRLRRGEYKKAVSDYNDSLALMPKNAWSLYGRGLAKLHLGINAEGQADIAAARALQPKIAEQAAAYGIVP
jgi:tetratricopeptide (TPR) repeat protein